MGFEEDTYNTIFKAMQHPIRRRILRMLDGRPATYTEIQGQLDIDNGLLNYHLDNMKDLLTKGEDGKYRLSEFGKAALGVTDRVEEPTRREGVSIKMLSGIILILVIATAALTTLNLSLYNNLVTQTAALSEATSELSEANQRLDALAPLGELAPLGIPPSYFSSGVTIVNGYPIYATYRHGGAYGLYDEYSDQSIAIFYVPTNGSIVKFSLIVDPVNVYDLNLTLQRGNAFKNETLVDLGTEGEYYHFPANVTDDIALRHVWRAPIVWSLDTHSNGVYETPALAEGWYTLTMFGPVTLIGHQPQYPMFRGSYYPVIGLNGQPIESYRAFIDISILKSGQLSYFAVTTPWPRN